MNKMEIGAKLQKLRGERTQKDVAQALGISPSALAMYENGQRVPRDEIKIALANYYGVSIQELFFTANVHHE